MLIRTPKSDLADMTSEVVADNSGPLAAILLNIPRGQLVRRVYQILLEFEQGIPLIFDASDSIVMRVIGANMKICNGEEKAKEESKSCTRSHG
ncbi:hypothetical protein RHMOL_Rhmol03G0183300 [Rhododendron molle]|uniref:Uncharacterized protein n=1 Tax=Rhododendron molle TaxID=49168 RepID=A0ACC0PH25_RHOML|nr:hypothetical protein RHMOL_Rhmol03G0183300 [Rhododendron molle]